MPVAINEIDVNPDSTPDSNGGAETEPQHTRQQVGTENDGNVDRDAERRRGRDEGLCGDGVCVCMCVCVCVCVCVVVVVMAGARQRETTAFSASLLIRLQEKVNDGLGAERGGERERERARERQRERQ